MMQKQSREDSDIEEIGPVPHNRGNKLKTRANMLTGGCRLSILDSSVLFETNASQDNGEDINHNNTNNVDNNLSRRILAKRGTAFLNSRSKLGGVVKLTNTKTTVVNGGGRSHDHHNGNGAIPPFRPWMSAAVIGEAAAAAAEAAALAEMNGQGRDSEEEEMDEDEDPYADIKIEEILSPLQSSTEVLKRPQCRRLFQSPQLQIMAVHAMAMIEREMLINKMMSRVALILQGDDPLYPELAYGLGEGCSTAKMGMPESPESIKANKDWKRNGKDREAVQKTLGLLMENINCSDQYINLLSRSRDNVNHVCKQKQQLWKKLKEKREKELRKLHHHSSRHQANNATGTLTNNGTGHGERHHNGASTVSAITGRAHHGRNADHHASAAAAASSHQSRQMHHGGGGGGGGQGGQRHQDHSRH